MQARTVSHNKLLVFLYLSAAVFICYAPALQNGFTNWDDRQYVLLNPHIQFSFKNIAYIFSNYFLGNYHPLTLLSLGCNYFFSGTHAIGYILTNIIFHALNCCLLFVFLCELKFSHFISFLTAMLFAVHPLHVESVAWIAERKDVLYVFFFLTALICYVRYYHGRNKTAYFLSLLFFICSCLSKGQAVMLSAVLFLIDYLLSGKAFQLKLFKEKIPFLLLSIAFGIISIKAQSTNADYLTTTDFSFIQRVAFGAHNYLFYIVKTIIPHRLCAFYPYPSIFRAEYYLFIIAALAILGSLLYYFRRNRVVVFSTLFFSTCIFILLQLFPVGDAEMADRYSYLAGVGLFIPMAVAAEHFIHKAGKRKNIIQFFVLVYFLFLAHASFARCSVWKNGITLWTDVINIYPETAIAYSNRGANQYDNGNAVAALNDFTKALQLDSSDSYARYNSAVIYYKNGEYESCVRMLDGLDAGKPSNADAVLLKAYSENKMKNYSSSLRDVEMYMGKNKSAEALTLSGLNKIMIGDYNNARKDLDEALKKDSSYSDAFVKRGVLFFNVHDTASACIDWQKAALLGDTDVVSIIQLYCK